MISIGPNASPATVFTATDDGIHTFHFAIGSAGAIDVQRNGQSIGGGTGINAAMEQTYTVFMAQGDTLDYQGPAAVLRGDIKL